MTEPTPARSAAGSHWAWIGAGVLAAVLAGGYLATRGEGTPARTPPAPGAPAVAASAPAPADGAAVAVPAEAVLDGVVAEFGRGLPRSFAPGLTLVSVTREGPRVVLTIRSDDRRVADAQRDPAALADVMQAEQVQLEASCDNVDMRHVLDQGVVVARRFVDAAGATFFEVSISAANCRR